MMPPRRKAPLRRLRRWILSAGLTLALVGGALAAIVLTLVNQAPEWWRSTDPTDPRTIVAGEEVENGVVNVMYELRPSEETPWTVTLHAADANAWLNTRLAQWLASSDAEFEWPREIRNLQVEFDEDLIQIGAEVNGPERTQIVSATLRPRFVDGELWVAAESVWVGRLPIPAEWIADRAGALVGDVVPARLLDNPDAAHLLSALAGECPLDEEPVIELGDGRRVRLLRLAAQRGRLIVQCRTEFE